MLMTVLQSLRPQIDKLDAAILVGYKTSVDGSAEKARTPRIRL